MGHHAEDRQTDTALSGHCEHKGGDEDPGLNIWTEASKTRDQREVIGWLMVQLKEPGWEEREMLEGQQSNSGLERKLSLSVE